VAGRARGARGGRQLGLDLGDPDFQMGFGERWARSQGYRRLVGIDEVGRGPVAGPVVAAAVWLPEDLERQLAADGLTDSKKLSAARREAFAARIREGARVGLGEVGPARIDAINILQATFEAMRLAVASLLESLDGPPDCLLVDGNQALRPTPVAGAAQKTLVKGDSRAVCIAAASVVAKVHRDAMMVAFDETYPGYRFGDHKGYLSQVHRDALDALGPSPIHRRSFRGVVPEPVASGEGAQ
jgi:ribonuclease HII